MLSNSETDAALDPTTGKFQLGTDHSWTMKGGGMGHSPGGSWQHTSFADPSRDSIQNSVTRQVHLNNNNKDESNSDSMDNMGMDVGQEELSLLEGELSSVQEFGWAFRRAQSRLQEMSGSQWSK